MRVLVVTEWYPSIKSPTAGVFVQRDTRLISEQHDVTLVHLASRGTVTDDDRIQDKGERFKVVRIERDRPIGVGKNWPTVAALLAESDLVHTHAFRTLLAFVGHSVRVPWVHSEHWSAIGHPQTLSWRGRAVLALTARTLRRPTIVTAVSRYLEAAVRKYRSGVTRVVPSVVSATQAVTPFPDHSTIRLLSVGNVIEHKGPHIVLEAVTQLQDRGYKVSLRWAGDGPELTALEAIKASGVEWLGSVPSEDIGKLLEDSHLFVLPTRSETLGLAILEAISHGRPVVVGSRGGQADYVTEENGVLISDRTPTAYADAIADLWTRLHEYDPTRIAQSLSGQFTPERVRTSYNEAFAEAQEIFRARLLGRSKKQ